MAKRSRKYEHAAHIKRHTVGTSNEISFDVLDAARAELEGESTKIRVPRGLLPGVRVPSLNFGLESRASLESGQSDDRASGTPEVVKPTKVEAAAPASASAVSRNDRKARKKQVKAEKRRRREQLADKPAPTPAVNPEQEIQRRKARRARHRRRVRAIIAIIVIAVVCAGGYTAFTQYQFSQNISEKTDALVQQVSAADDQLGTLDTLMLDPINAITDGSWKTMQSQLDEQKATLKTCSQEAADLAQTVFDQKTKDALTQISAGATSRVTIIGAAESVFAEAERAHEALEAANSAWMVLVDADNLARESSSLISTTSTDASEVDAAVTSSMEKAEEAQARFNEAASELREVEQLYTGVDLSAYIDYADKRAEAMGYAIASDQAILDRDSAEASAQDTDYAQADEDAVALAANFPTSISDPIKAAFDENKKGLVAVYDEARTNAASSDVVIRDYLGATNK